MHIKSRYKLPPPVKDGIQTCILSAIAVQQTNIKELTTIRTEWNILWPTGTSYQTDPVKTDRNPKKKWREIKRIQRRRILTVCRHLPPSPIPSPPAEDSARLGLEWLHQCSKPGLIWSVEASFVYPRAENSLETISRIWDVYTNDLSLT